jgi:hypothetical protein
MRDLSNLAALLATLALGAAAWWLTRGATAYLITNLIGALVLWVVLVMLTIGLAGALAKTLREGR